MIVLHDLMPFNLVKEYERLNEELGHLNEEVDLIHGHNDIVSSSSSEAENDFDAASLLNSICRATSISHTPTPTDEDNAHV